VDFSVNNLNNSSNSSLVRSVVSVLPNRNLGSDKVQALEGHKVAFLVNLNNSSPLASNLVPPSVVALAVHFSVERREVQVDSVKLNRQEVVFLARSKPSPNRLDFLIKLKTLARLDFSHSNNNLKVKDSLVKVLDSTNPQEVVSDKSQRLVNPSNNSSQALAFSAKIKLRHNLEVREAFSTKVSATYSAKTNNLSSLPWEDKVSLASRNPLKFQRLA
jgi:hypothetical protein